MRPPLLGAVEGDWQFNSAIQKQIQHPNPNITVVIPAYAGMTVGCGVSSPYDAPNIEY